KKTVGLAWVAACEASNTILAHLCTNMVTRRGVVVMPAKPAWHLRVPEILEELKTMIVPFLDRAAIEKSVRHSPSAGHSAHERSGCGIHRGKDVFNRAAGTHGE